MIPLTDLLSLARSYFMAICIYNHDDVDGEQDCEGIKHDTANTVSEVLKQKVTAMLDSEDATVCFVYRDSNNRYYMVCLVHSADGDDAYINGEIVTGTQDTSEGDHNKRNKFMAINTLASFQYTDDGKLNIVQDGSDSSSDSCSAVTFALNSAGNIVAVLEDDNKYSAWNKVTRRLLITEVESKGCKVSYCKQNFMLPGESDSDMDIFPKDNFLYNRTDLNDTFYVYDTITFYGLLIGDDETVYTRIEKTVVDGTVQLTIGEGTTKQVIIPSSISSDGKIIITVDRNTGLHNDSYEIAVLFVAIGVTQLDLTSKYDVREVLFKTQDGSAAIKNRYIGRVTPAMVKMIPDYNKFQRFDIAPADSTHSTSTIADGQFDLQRDVTFYSLDIDTSHLVLQADNTTQGSVGYPEEKSGLTMRFVDSTGALQYALLPSDLEKACYIDESRVNQYMCGDYDYVTADADGLIFNSKLVRSIDLFNYTFTVGCNSKYDMCTIKPVRDNEARIPFTLLCNMATYRYFLSDCYSSKYTLPVGEDSKPAKIDSFTPYSVNSDFLPTAADGLDCTLTFNTMFTAIKRSGYTRWLLAFQLNLTNIDAVDSNTVYFDQAVPFGETRHVYVYVVNAKVPFIIFKHADIDGTDVCQLASVSLVKINNYDAIECKTPHGERIVISGSDKSGKVYTERAGNLERCLPINAKADFDTRNNSYNVYRCTIASLYVDRDSKKTVCAQPRKAAVDSFINVYVPNKDIRLNDQYTVKGFYTFCTDAISQYKEYAGIEDSDYTTIQAIYNDFATSYGGSDKKSPLSSLYLFIGVEYMYKYEKGTTSTYNIPHYYGKFIKYEIDTTKSIGKSNDNTSYLITDATVHNYSPNLGSYILPYYSYGVTDSTNGVIAIKKVGDTTYTINFGPLEINTLENYIIPGDLYASVEEGDYDDIADYLDNNGIDMYQVHTFNGTKQVVYPIDFVDRKDSASITAGVTVKNVLIKVIPEKVSSE